MATSMLWEITPLFWWWCWSKLRWIQVIGKWHGFWGFSTICLRTYGWTEARVQPEDADLSALCAQQWATVAFSCDQGERSPVQQAQRSHQPKGEPTLCQSRAQRQEEKRRKLPGPQQTSGQEGTMLHDQDPRAGSMSRIQGVMPPQNCLDSIVPVHVVL